MKQYTALRGAFAYEFRMQIRRPALWIVMLCFGALQAVLGNGALFDLLLHNPGHYSGVLQVVDWATRVNVLFPILVGVLLADRLSRDGRTRMNEVLNTLPASLGSRLAGKYLGTTLASILPVFLYYCLGLGLLSYSRHDLLIFPLGLEVFAAVILPGILFISAFSIACPAFIWTPIYQFLFVGYWFWGNLFPANIGIPTLSPTILTPIGGYMAAGFYGYNDVYQVHTATSWQGAASLSVLVCIAVLAIVALSWLLKWRQAQQ
jgi:ABC-type transport system involved in multi-copper enzyme maturation permease subunit